MKKIISLFQRNYDGDRLVRDEVVPGADWVVAGEGVATRKFDGTCCMVRDGRLFKRYDAKRGKTPPGGFEPAQELPDPVTGHWPGWLPVINAPEDRYHCDAVAPDSPVNCGLLDGTYELCGPKINGNPEGYEKHLLVPHGKLVLPDAPRTFSGLREYLRPGHIEGVVWWHPDGRMVKIKAKDFGFKRSETATTHYLPSCGTELMQFYDDFCEHCDCPEEVAWQEKGDPPGCHWLIMATALNQQPPAWVVKNGMPTCLAFRRRGERN